MRYWGDDIPPYARARIDELGETLAEAFPVEEVAMPPSITCLMLELSQERPVGPSSRAAQLPLHDSVTVGRRLRSWAKGLFGIGA